MVHLKEGDRRTPWGLMVISLAFCMAVSKYLERDGDRICDRLGPALVTLDEHMLLFHNKYQRKRHELAVKNKMFWTNLKPRAKRCWKRLRKRRRSGAEGEEDDDVTEDYDEGLEYEDVDIGPEELEEEEQEPEVPPPPPKRRSRWPKPMVEIFYNRVKDMLSSPSAETVDHAVRRQAARRRRRRRVVSGDDALRIITSEEARKRRGRRPSAWAWGFGLGGAGLLTGYRQMRQQNSGILA